MASANVTLGQSGRDFEADNTERTATLNVPGGTVFNRSTTESAFLNVEGGTVDMVDPLGPAGREVPIGGSAKLPNHCRSFKFRTASGSVYLQYEPRL